PRGHPQEERKRNLNFEELKDWGPKDVIKMSTPLVKKMPPSAANLPLRFGRNIEVSISRHVPNLPQRFGRMTTAK
ncbi:PREDICTED: pro-FMRFamide-related neuropeptide VF-like, partial [Galeopterus variegatus]|uniref:Pro-FMRFamide-related neuropeptide VF n=1 Tax=Galeopterus variegatus TaxID=482537 RepID=A0ABM0Q6A9_GALVR